MYNLIWRSVTCRPGNGGLLSGVKRPIIAQTIATARRCDPIKDHTVASVVPPIGLRPHSGTTLATLSHPDCRSVLTLIVAGQEGDKEPSKYWLSTLPATTTLVDLVHRAKLRWRIERDYQLDFAHFSVGSSVNAEERV